MNAKKCDRCGNYYEIYQYPVNQPVLDKHGNTITIWNTVGCYDHKVKNFDLCKPCMTELENFLGMNKEAKEHDKKGNT